jgi:hypothetical protein
MFILSKLILFVLALGCLTSCEEERIEAVLISPFEITEKYETKLFYVKLSESFLGKQKEKKKSVYSVSIYSKDKLQNMVMIYYHNSGDLNGVDDAVQWHESEQDFDLSKEFLDALNIEHAEPIKKSIINIAIREWEKTLPIPGKNEPHQEK